ncbi:MAG: thiolase family protein [Chitinophagaceae bacterium]
MKTCYIIDAVRTPVAKYGGKLAHIRPDDLLAKLIKELVNRSPSIDVHAIEDIIAGDANQAGEDCRNVARMAGLLAGLPITVGGNTVNRLCGSGLQSIMDAARAVMCNEGLLYIAAGVESMTRAPFIVPKQTDNWRQPNLNEIYDSTIGWRFTNEQLTALYPPLSMGETAEILAEEFAISREEQDLFAFHSHQKYFTAKAANKWQNELITVNYSYKEQSFLLAEDENPRNSSIRLLQQLKPAFKTNGTVTAGNASGLHDGAAAMLLASEEAVKLFNLQPIGIIKSMAIAGVHPNYMGLGPVAASNKAFQRAGIKVKDIDLIELNEAFAVQALACMQSLDLNPEIVNVNGGSIAIGYPLGSCGTRMATTLLHEMKRTGKKIGLASMCVGLGQGSSIIIENVE